MSTQPRGLIRNREHAGQIRLFAGMRWGTITPTDIDGLIDFGGEAFVIIETKYGDAKLPTGQRLALERLADVISSTGRPCVALVASHHSSGDIVVGECQVTECQVTEYRFRGAWHAPRQPMTVCEAIEGFRKKHVT